MRHLSRSARVLARRGRVDIPRDQAPVALHRRPAAGSVTFTKDVAPILQRSCQHCHRPGSIAPMSLMIVRGRRGRGRGRSSTRVSLRQMPPWHVDKTVGIKKFKDDPSLSDDEIATIVTWVDDGTPRGNPADMPPPRQFEDWEWWNIGKPDLIVTLPKDVTVPPQGPDWWTDIQADPGLTEDRYIKAVEVKPGPARASASCTTRWRA